MEAYEDGGGGDLDIAMRAVSDYARDAFERFDLIGRLENRAVKLVRTHWNKIEALADVLVRRRDIEGGEAVRIIEEVTL